jgi:hypothetical protein
MEMATAAVMLTLTAEATVAAQSAAAKVTRTATATDQAQRALH